MNAQATATQYLTEIKFRNAAKKVLPGLANKADRYYNISGVHVDYMFDEDGKQVDSYSINRGRAKEGMWFELTNLSAMLAVKLQMAGFESSLIETSAGCFGGERRTAIVWRKAA